MVSMKCSTSLILSIAIANFGSDAFQTFNSFLKFLNLAVSAMARSVICSGPLHPITATETKSS